MLWQSRLHWRHCKVARQLQPTNCLFAHFTCRQNLPSHCGPGSRVRLHTPNGSGAMIAFFTTSWSRAYCTCSSSLGVPLPRQSPRALQSHHNICIRAPKVRIPQLVLLYDQMRTQNDGRSRGQKTQDLSSPHWDPQV